MKLTDDQRAELAARVGTAAANELAPLIESWLSSEPPGWLDLRERLQRAVCALEGEREDRPLDTPRLGGKIEGVKLALDYLRAHMPAETRDA